jgi:CHASE1-domain containing sensor protein
MSSKTITRYLPWLTAVVGLTLTALAWRAALVREERVLAARFQAEAEQVGRAAGWEVTLFTDVLQSLGPLHALSDRVTAYDFEEFARKGMAHQKAVLGPFGFAQWIPAALRTALEDPGPEGASGLSLTEYDALDGVRLAGDRTDYFPITYQHPERGLDLPNGFDLASLPEAKAVLSRMLASRQPALGPSTVGAREPGGDGFYIFAPIFDDDGRSPVSPPPFCGPSNCCGAPSNARWHAGSR